MQWLTSVLMIIQVVSAIGVITLILLQQGKGADMGAAFGGGASGSLFGATGSANFLSRTTGVLATLFFAATLGLAMLVTARQAPPASVMDTVPASTAGQAAPAAGTAPDVPAAASKELDAAQEKGGASDIPK